MPVISVPQSVPVTIPGRPASHNANSNSPPNSAKNSYGGGGGGGYSSSYYSDLTAADDALTASQALASTHNSTPGSPLNRSQRGSFIFTSKAFLSLIHEDSGHTALDHHQHALTDIDEHQIASTFEKKEEQELQQQQQQRRPANLNTLPAEILTIILQYVALLNPPETAPRALAKVLPTCFAIYDVGIAVLYRRVAFPYPHTFDKFRKSIEQSGYGILVRALDFSAFTSVGLGRTGKMNMEIQMVTNHTILRALELCPNLHEFCVAESVDMDMDSRIMDRLLQMPLLEAVDFCGSTSKQGFITALEQSHFCIADNNNNNNNNGDEQENDHLHFATTRTNTIPATTINASIITPTTATTSTSPTTATIIPPTSAAPSVNCTTTTAAAPATVSIAPPPISIAPPPITITTTTTNDSNEDNKPQFMTGPFTAPVQLTPPGGSLSYLHLSPINLKKLSFHGCSTITAELFMKILPRLTHITHLDLTHTQVTPDALLSLPPTARLTHLSLAKCVKLTSHGLLKFLLLHPSTRQLEWLNIMYEVTKPSPLSYNDFDTILRYLPASLKYLNLYGLPVKERHLPTIETTMTQLRGLSLGHANLQLDTLCKFLSNMKNLQYVDLTGNPQVTLWTLQEGSLFRANPHIDIYEFSADTLVRIKGITIPGFGLEIGKARRGWLYRQFTKTVDNVLPNSTTTTNNNTTTSPATPPPRKGFSFSSYAQERLRKHSALAIRLGQYQAQTTIVFPSRVEDHPAFEYASRKVNVSQIGIAGGESTLARRQRGIFAYYAYHI